MIRVKINQLQEGIVEIDKTIKMLKEQRNLKNKQIRSLECMDRKVGKLLGEKPEEEEKEPLPFGATEDGLGEP